MKIKLFACWLGLGLFGCQEFDLRKCPEPITETTWAYRPAMSAVLNDEIWVPQTPLPQFLQLSPRTPPIHYTPRVGSGSYGRSRANVRFIREFSRAANDDCLALERHDLLEFVLYSPDVGNPADYDPASVRYVDCLTEETYYLDTLAADNELAIEQHFLYPDTLDVFEGTMTLKLVSAAGNVVHLRDGRFRLMTELGE